MSKDINLELCKPNFDFDVNEFKETLNQIWEFIECNFDKKIEKIVVEGTDAQVYLSYSLDICQIERLQDNFNIINGVDTYSEYILVELDI